MKSIWKLLIVAIILTTSCKDDAADPTVDCSNNQNHNVQGYFDTLNGLPGYHLYETMDLLTHQYTFTTTAAIQICGFGYKSQNANMFYTIELTGSGSTPLYTGNLTFSASQFEHVSVPPITLQPGTYTLKRTLPNGTNLGETIGPITRAGTTTSPMPPSFPVSLSPDISIIATDFYGSGGPVPNYGIPNIYFDYISL